MIRTITAFTPGPLGGICQMVDHASDTTLWWYEFTSVPLGGYYISHDTRIVLPAESQLDIGAALAGDEGADISAHGFVLTNP